MRMVGEPRNLSSLAIPFVSDEHFMDLSHDALRGQDTLDEFHCLRVRGTCRHIQDFNLHFSLSGFLEVPSLKIGQ